MAVVLALGALGRAQRPSAGADPYTAGKTASVQRMGYVSFGPFPLGNDHGSDDVDVLVGSGRMRWLETRHFRIGSSLGDRALPEESRTRKALYEATRRFKKRLGAPLVDPSFADGWLQVHLLAQVMEETYADLEARLGVTTEWLRAHADEQGHGGGPYLGNDEKYVLLVFEQEADLGRYLRRYCDCREDRPFAHWFAQTRNHVYATSAESCQAQLQDPLVLQGHVVHGMVQNFLDAFAIREAGVPYWWREGLAHWFARRVDPRLVNITNLNTDDPSNFAEWDWAEKVRGRARQGLLPVRDELLTWCDGRACSLADHAAMWSFVDYLMAQGDMSFFKFALQIRERPMRSRFCPASIALAWHDEAFLASYGADRAAVDARWRKSTLGTKR